MKSYTISGLSGYASWSSSRRIEGLYPLGVAAVKRCNLGVTVVASGGKDSGRRGEGMGEDGKEEAVMLRMAVWLTVAMRKMEWRGNALHMDIWTRPKTGEMPDRRYI